MEALDVYRNCLIELDKYESPSFSIRDFNYFINSAVTEFVDAKLDVGPDIIQSDHDDLAVLLSDPTSLTFGSGATVNVASLPSGYRNMLGLKIVVTVTTAFENYAVNDEITIYPKKRPSNREGYTEKNAYQEPYDEQAWYELRGSNIEVFIDPRTQIKSGTIRFLKLPKAIYLNPSYQTLNPTDQALEANNTSIEFQDHTMAKITKVCRRIFLENIESNRYGPNVQEQNLRSF